ncbi:ATP-binding protein [Sphingomonas sp. MMS12-HWE2-04]|uniref:ATP-binding protein n=1 Tax=Sphingomonas sp. MMS12-HWE2-04 TaxID=3234199 RepID=UPI00384DEF34
MAAQTVEVNAEDATSIGILVSELVGNACKYAYAADEPGDIAIQLETLPLGGYRLDVADRGCGMAADAAPQGTGLGARLIAMMASRLGGEQGWHDAGPGTRFTLRVAKL